jgi:hypothetical protein
MEIMAVFVLNRFSRVGALEERLLFVMVRALNEPIGPIIQYYSGQYYDRDKGKECSGGARRYSSRGRRPVSQLQAKGPKHKHSPNLVSDLI